DAVWGTCDHLGRDVASDDATEDAGHSRPSSWPLRVTAARLTAAHPARNGYQGKPPRTGSTERLEQRTGDTPGVVGRQDRADHADARSAGGQEVRDVDARDAADGDDGDARGRDRLPEPRHALWRPESGLRRRRVHRSEEREVRRGGGDLP